MKIDATTKVLLDDIDKSLDELKKLVQEIKNSSDGNVPSRLVPAMRFGLVLDNINNYSRIVFTGIVEAIGEEMGANRRNGDEV